MTDLHPEDTSRRGVPTSVRLAVEADFGAIELLINASFPNDTPIDKETISSWVSSGGVVLVAVISERVVGCVRLDQDRYGLFHLAVIPELRRRGIGAQLVSAAERCARQLRWPRIFLGVNEAEPYLITYYKEEFGYDLTGDVLPNATNDAGSAKAVQRKLIIMAKQLLGPRRDADVSRAEELIYFIQEVALGKRPATEQEVYKASKELDGLLAESESDTDPPA